MPGWEPVVAEQLALLAHVGLKDVKSYIIGPTEAQQRVLEIAAHYGVRVEVLGTESNFGALPAEAY
jgi:hypothetical protein